MLSTRDRHRSPAVALLAAIALAGWVAGCSKGDSSAPAASAPPAEQPAAGSAGGPIGISSGGVTTRIDVPAQSTEEQYGQACMAAKEWMTAKGGDPDTLVEPYLKDIQVATTDSPVTFNTTWTKLSDAQRAAVLIAVRAAADGGC